MASTLCRRYGSLEGARSRDWTNDARYGLLVVWRPTQNELQRTIGGDSAAVALIHCLEQRLGLAEQTIARKDVPWPGSS